MKGMTTMTVTHKCNKEAEIKEIYTMSIQQAEQLNQIQSDLKDIKHKLLGNGRPGIMQDIEVIKAERNFIKWVIPIISGVIAIIMPILVKLLWK